jgi:hypothetical protein
VTLYRYQVTRATGDLRPGDKLLHDDATGEVTLVRFGVMDPAHLDILERNGVTAYDPPIGQDDAPPVRESRATPPRGRTLAFKPKRSNVGREHATKGAR